MIETLLAELRPRYPALPACLVLEPVSPSAPPWQLAYFTGLDDGGCAHIALRPGCTRRDAAHELCHALHILARDGRQLTAGEGGDSHELDDAVLVGFWMEAEPNATLAEAADLWRSMRAAGATPGQTWEWEPREVLAEAFAAIATGDPPTTPVHARILANYGIDVLARRAQLEAFFRSLHRRTLGATAGATTVDPIARLLSFPVTRPFGDLSLPAYGRHTGVDLGLPAGTPVFAIADGIVVLDDDDGAYDFGDTRTWSGIAVQCRHAEDSATSTYAHLTANVVRHGQYVRAGELIGYCGSTGASTGPHLHLEVRLITGELVDPITYMEEGMFTSEDRARLERIEKALHDPATGSPWPKEIFDKIQAGFNVTLATWLRRVVLARDPVLKSSPVVDPDA